MSEEKKIDPVFIVSSSPHAHSGASVQRIMLDVIIALVPIMLISFYFLHWNVVRLIAVCVVSCVVTEAVCRKMMGRDAGIGDLSAVVTGILLALNLPLFLPSWMAVIGSVFAIGVAKQLFGGIGYNPFNPALVGRVVLLISFTGPMTTWIKWQGHVDAVATATPLAMVKGAVKAGTALPVSLTPGNALTLFVGETNGCVGEISAAAIILGGIYLLVRKCISWHIPVFYVGTVALFSAVLWKVDPGSNMAPQFHVLAGGLLIGAVFMATDMVTSPVTKKGQMVFGMGCGVITMLIRRWGGYPEGVSFAILLMNSVTPLINRATRPRIFGARKKS